jgi:predicted nucleic acid-binding protein
LNSIGINIDGETAIRAFHDILSLARAQSLSTYDASYLELALRKGLPLATLDNKLKAAAAAVGVPLYQVTP